MGENAYLLGCGAPILPSVGLVDAMRVSPDTFHEGGEDGSQGLRGRMSLEARAWQHGRLWTTDPDCLVARPRVRAARGVGATWCSRHRDCAASPTGSRARSRAGCELVRQLLEEQPRMTTWIWNACEQQLAPLVAQLYDRQRRMRSSTGCSRWRSAGRRVLGPTEKGARPTRAPPT